MTDPTPLVATVQPSSMQVSSSDEYQAADLILTITNLSPSASYDLSSGLTIVIPVDPGGSGTQAALVLSSASGTAGGQGQPTPTVPVTMSVEPGTEWTFIEVDPDTCTYTAEPDGSGLLAPLDSIQFGFTPVVADLVPGTANITVTVPPAAGTGTILTLTAPITKLPAPLSATLDAETPLLTMPDNTTNLTWQVLGADSCSLTWDPPTTVVTYGGEQYHGEWSSPPFQFGQDDPLPVATVYQDTSFVLTANGQGQEVTATQGVTLATPTLTALTIPPLVTGVTPASGDPGGGQQVTITGTGLFGTSTTVSITFGDASAAAITVSPDGGSITATTPPGTAGSTVPVTVITQTGASVAIPAASYTYAPAGVPVVTGIDPPGGDPAGGQQVTITGTGLAGATAVTFGSASATSFTVNTDGTVTAIPPAVTLSAGTTTSTVAVTVSTPAGSSPPTPAASYTYAAAGIPVVGGVTQDGAGDPDGGQQVTITGFNFSGATSVSFGSASTTCFHVVDSAGTTITATAPPAAATDVTSSVPGTTVDVTVTLSGESTSPASSAKTAADRYTYANTPPSSAVSPYQPFLLVWSCYENTGQTLSWSLSSTEPQGITDTGTIVIGAASGPVSNGGPIAPSDTAVVIINAPTTFALHVTTPGEPVPAPVPAGIGPVAIGEFLASVPVVDPTYGTQSVTLTWTAQNATGFSLTGDGVNEPSLPYDQRSYPSAPLPLSSLAFFTLTANGFNGSGAYAPVSQSIAVEPWPAEVIINTPSVQAQVSDPRYGTQTAIVEWEALNTTSVTITGGAQPVDPGIHTTSASVELPYPPPSSGPVSYPVTIEAAGYVQPGVPLNKGTVIMIPTPVAITAFTASTGDEILHPGSHVTLRWGAIAATGFSLTAGTLSGDTFPVPGSPFGPETTEQTFAPSVSVTYTLTAQGYPAAARLPSQSVTVDVRIKPPKEDEALLEKNPPDSGRQPFAGTVPGPGDLASPDPAPPGGTEESFIRPDERPGVTAPGEQGPGPVAGQE